MALTLTADERRELERRRRSQAIRSEDARRARVIPVAGRRCVVFDDRGRGTVLPRFHQSVAPSVLGQRLDGLQSRHHSQTARVLTPEMEARISTRRASGRPTAAHIGARGSWPACSPSITTTWRPRGRPRGNFGHRTADNATGTTVEAGRARACGFRQIRSPARPF
jgi:hypothetical protein